MAITVSRLSMTPVKGTRIRDVDSIELCDSGAIGDRAFYIVDEEGGLVNGKRLGELQTVIADHDPAAETLALHFADGETVSGPVRLGGELTTRFFSSARPARVLEGPFGAALSRRLGQPLTLVAGGSAVDRGAEGAVSLVSRGSLERLAQEADDPAPVDARRFRMLIELDGPGAHEEDRWVGRELAVGTARLRVCGHVGRCVTTTRSPDSGAVDWPTLKLLGAYRLDEPTSEPLGFGVHGAVLAPGSVRLGDKLTIGPRES